MPHLSNVYRCRPLPNLHRTNKLHRVQCVNLASNSHKLFFSVRQLTTVGKRTMFPGRPCGCPLTVRKLTPMLHDMVSLYLVEEFPCNLADTFII